MMNWRKLRRRFVSYGSLAFVAFAGVSWFVAGTIVAPVNHPVGPPPAGYGIESLSIRSQSGSDVAGWYIGSERASATVILLHPIRADRRAMLGRAKLLHDAGYAVLLVDLQAHGESPGENITAGYRERLDVTAAVNFVRSKTPVHRIGVVGWSLGGAAALLASPLQIDSLVLESVYPTIEEAVRNRISMRLGVVSHVLTPALLVQLKPRLGVSPSQMCPIDHICEVRCPVLIAAGDDDEHTTLTESNRLYEAANQPKQLVVFEGAAHQDLFKYDPNKYKEIVAFLDRHLGNNDSEKEDTEPVNEAHAGN